MRSTEEMAEAIGRSSEIDPAACRAEAELRFSLANTIENYFGLYRALTSGETLDRWLAFDPFPCTGV